MLKRHAIDSADEGFTTCMAVVSVVLVKVTTYASAKGCGKSAAIDVFEESPNENSQ